MLARAVAAVLAAAGCHAAPIRIVEGSADFGGGAGGGFFSGPASSLFPIASRAPQPLAGPRALHALQGSCFSTVVGGYQYKMCPFHNITQTEDSSRWNAFRTIIGLWGRMGPDDARGLPTMEFTDGSSCTDEVRLACGETPAIVRVEETRPCVYDMEFAAPQVCALAQRVCGGDCPSQLVPWLDQAHATDCLRQGRDAGGEALVCGRSALRAIACDALAHPGLCCGQQGGVCCAVPTPQRRLAGAIGTLADAAHQAARAVAAEGSAAATGTCSLGDLPALTAHLRDLARAL